MKTGSQPTLARTPPRPGTQDPLAAGPAPLPDASPVVRAVEVRRSAKRKRTVSAKLQEGTLILYLPAWVSPAEEKEWIDRMRVRFEARDRKRRINSTGELERRAADINVRYFQGLLRWKSIEYVTNQRGRYGSCSVADATIRLSDCLCEMPPWVRDYVIVHEMAHLAVPNHSDKFWDLVNRYPLSERARGFLIAKGLES